LKSFGAGLLQSLTDSDDQKIKGKISISKCKGREKYLQKVGAKEAPLYC
jgi:hypothetical protein